MFHKYFIIITSLFIIFISILFIVIILIQNPIKGGINQSFMEKNFRIFGVRRTNTFLDKITWFLSLFILLLIFIFNHSLK